MTEIRAKVRKRQETRTVSPTDAPNFHHASTSIAERFAIEMRCRQLLRRPIEIDESIFGQDRIDDALQRIGLNVEFFRRPLRIGQPVELIDGVLLVVDLVRADRFGLEKVSSKDANEGDLSDLAMRDA